MKLKIFGVFLILFFTQYIYSKDYNASFFGIESNGTTLNTTSIQKAIDFIHEKGGGRLVFSVGRYLTGSIYLKSDVTIHLKEGAVLVGSTNPFDYERIPYWTALIFGHNQENIGITGKGLIDGRGYELSQNVISMIHRRVIEDDRFGNDRPQEGLRALIIYFKFCKNVKIEDIQLKDPACWTQLYDRCQNLLIENITVDSKNYWNNDGLDVVDCDSVIIRNNFIDASDDGICIKSFYTDSICQNILVENNVVRSSASGIKFGTFTHGTFKNIKIVNNTVYDTYRSAITIATVDGAHIENIIVDSLKAINTGNAIFLRIGERREGRKGSMKNITISNVYAEIPATKPDAGYPYEGPVEHLPRNISPASIVGLPGNLIENVTLKNIEIHYYGGGDPNYAKIGLDDLDLVPELPDKYPEFSMFKELPAWGFYIRHAKGIVMDNVSLSCKKEDYRIAVVLDDVHKIQFKNLQVAEPGDEKKMLHSHNSTEVKFK